MSKYGLIFDVDGVIADTEAVNARASIKMFEDLFGIEGVKREDFQAGLGRGAEAYVKAAAEIHGLALTDEQLIKATKTRQKNFLKILAEQPLAAYEGVLELMNAALGRDDFKVAIATSGTRQKSLAVLKAAKVPYKKMVYITAGNVKNKKPDPELFLTAAKQMELEPNKSVVIEDAPNGVEAARRAGCKCIAVTNSMTAAKLTRADMVVASLAEIDTDTVISLIESK